MKIKGLLVGETQDEVGFKVDSVKSRLRDQMILAKMARLETRTKESTYYASVKVEKPKREPKGM
jgi:hypothetical protein